MLLYTPTRHTAYFACGGPRLAQYYRYKNMTEIIIDVDGDDDDASALFRKRIRIRAYANK